MSQKCTIFPNTFRVSPFALLLGCSHGLMHENALHMTYMPLLHWILTVFILILWVTCVTF